MRRYLFVLPFVLACARADEAPADSAAAAMPPALTEADVAGTWTGTLMAEGSDSVIAHWTNICGAGTCRLTTQESPRDTVTSTYTIQGDSVVAMTAAYAAPEAKGAMVTDHWVARLSGGQVTGTGMFRLADRPDSVVMRYRFTGMRNP